MIFLAWALGTHLHWFLHSLVLDIDVNHSPTPPFTFPHWYQKSEKLFLWLSRFSTLSKPLWPQMEWTGPFLRGDSLSLLIASPSPSSMITSIVITLSVSRLASSSSAIRGRVRIGQWLERRRRRRRNHGHRHEGMTIILNTTINN